LDWEFPALIAGRRGLYIGQAAIEMPRAVGNAALNTAVSASPTLDPSA
jgi:hypothetical protein